MATFEAGLYGYVTTHDNASAVQTLIGTRMYDVGSVPQKPTLPYLTYQRITTSRTMSSDGDSGLPTGLFQINLWAATYAAVRDLSDKLRLAMNGFPGDFGSHVVHGAVLENESDFPQLPEDGSEMGDHGVQQDWSIDYEESRPTF